MSYIVKPIVCDYAVILTGTHKIVFICNIKRNAELIADILNGDTDNRCAYSYDVYPNAKFKVVKAENEHKRTIDADELLKRIAEKCKTPSLSADTVNGLCGATAIIYDMLNESEE